MDTRQHLVEEWQVKLAVSEEIDKDGERRFGWVRQIYSRIYRFLISCYGDAEWRGAGDDSSSSEESSSNASHMPFFDYRPTADGLAPKSPARIREALDSIHSSNPGIATAGTMRGVDDDSWVVVAASRKSRYACAVHRRLLACGIDAILQDRTTDMAVVVRHEDFRRALAEVQNVRRTKQRQFSTRVDPVRAVGLVLLISSVIAFLAVVLLFNEMLPGATPVATILALWLAGLLSSWLLARGRRGR